MKNLELRIEKEELRIVMGSATPLPKSVPSGTGRRDCQFLILNSKFLICFAATMLCSVAMADSLKFKFAPGDKYLLVSVTEQKASRIVDGNERTVEQTTRLECDFDVEEVDESGTAWAKYTYKRVTMKIRSPEQKTDFDSDANQLKTPLQAAPLRMVMGESLYLQITPQGRIEKINGLASLVTYAKGKMGNVQGADVVSRSIEQQFDEPDVKRTLENQFAVFPDSDKGETTWRRAEVLSVADVGSPKTERVEDANVVSEGTFRLNPDKSGLPRPLGAGRSGIAVVDVNLVIKPIPVPAVSEPTSEQDITTSVRTSREISGSGTGRAEIEEATGRIINYTMTQDMVERVKLTTQGPMLRPPPAPEPLILHRVTTFQMTKAEGAKPTQPADLSQGEVSPSADANK